MTKAEGMVQDGTQAIRRAAAVLQWIARRSESSPATLRAMAEAFDLPRSTAHRILKSLTDTRLATYNPRTRHYEIGLLCYELGLAVTYGVSDIARLRRPMDRVAARTGLTTYLLRRSGIEAVCVAKVEGTAVIRVIPVEMGDRRFLGVGAGATALLASLGDDTVEKVLAEAAPELARYANLTVDGIRQMVAETRRTGFAVSQRQVYSSTFGIGMVIPSGDRPAEFALSIAAYAPEVTEQRIKEWQAVMAQEVAVLALEAADETR